MTRTEKENLVPVWERITISLEEAAAYSGKISKEDCRRMSGGFD